MSVTKSLKEQWNRFCCVMDGNGSDFFMTDKVDQEMAKTGWTVKREYPVGVINSFGGYVPQYVNVTAPNGERINGQPERMQEYYAARKAAARTVYGIK